MTDFIDLAPDQPLTTKQWEAEVCEGIHAMQVEELESEIYELELALQAKREELERVNADH